MHSKIIHIEDDPVVRLLVASQLAVSEEHQLVGEATTFSAAIEMLGRVATGELGANLIILDGNLSDSRDSRDAENITRVIREFDLPVRVLGFSGENLLEQGIQLDAFVQKGSVSSLSKLTQAINDLRQLE